MWYGRVTPHEVDAIVKETIIGGKVLAPLLRGGMVTFSPSIANATQTRLTLPASKTDPFRKGVSILLAAQPEATTCPVTSLALLFAVDSQPPHAPLFAEADGSPLSRTSFISCLKSDLARCGFDAQLYSGHSFCQGAASSVAVAGYSDYEQV